MMTRRRTRSVIATLLLLSTTGIGVAWAASDIRPFGLAGHERHGERAEAPATHLAEARGQEREDDGARRHREHDHDDDDDEDEGEGAGRAALLPTGPADPRAPVPDNGLFNGKARPQVEVK